MANEKLIYASSARGAILRADPRLSYLIDNIKGVDAVEVVRCKDCKHCTVTADGMVCECALPTKRMQDYYIYGSTILARVEPDAFCSHGERREGE